MMALKTKVLPKTVVIITVISALIPKDCIDLFHKTIPGMVAKIMQILVLNQALDIKLKRQIPTQSLQLLL